MNIVLSLLLFIIIICTLNISSELIMDNTLHKININNEFDKMWLNNNDYDDNDPIINIDEITFNFFHNADIIIYCNNNHDDYIAYTDYCNPTYHNVSSDSSSSSSDSSSDALLDDNKCNLRSAWNTCELNVNSSCMIILPEDELIYMDILTYGSLILSKNNHIYINGNGTTIININHNNQLSRSTTTLKEESLISYNQNDDHIDTTTTTTTTTTTNTITTTTLILYRLSIKYFFTSLYGSALRIIGNCTLIISNVNFIENHADVAGGSIFIYNNLISTYIIHSKFQNNNVFISGGAIFIDDSKFIIMSNVSFDDCYADRYGGAIFVSNSNNITITNSLFNKNLFK